MKIYVKDNNISKALRVLKKKMLLEGDLKELREREHFIPETQRRRMEEKAGRKRWLKKQAQSEQNKLKLEQMAIRQNRKKKTTNQSQKPVA